jgi:large subunit ribosomal protein L20
MPRVKGGFRTRRTHKKILKLAKGYRGSRNRLFKRANEAVVRAGEHAFEGRKQRKRNFRTLWISRLSSALSSMGINYSRFIFGLNKAKITMDRKSLSEMAINDPKAFETIVEKVKKILS